MHTHTQKKYRLYNNIQVEQHIQASTWGLARRRSDYSCRLCCSRPGMVMKKKRLELVNYYDCVFNKFVITLCVKLHIKELKMKLDLVSSYS